MTFQQCTGARYFADIPFLQVPLLRYFFSPLYVQGARRL
jgi:hypothetical protein